MTWFAVGAFAVGCGSGPGAAVDAPDFDENPPASADDPPTGSPEAPPASADDAPTANPDAPGGGSPPDNGGGQPDPEGLCRELCNSVDTQACEAGELAAALAAICATGCRLPAEQQSCAREAADAISCLLAIDGLCVSPPSQGQVQSCQQAFSRVDACSEGGQPTNPDPDPPGGDSCTLTGDQCMGCADECDQCNCALGGMSAELCASLCM